MGEVTSSTVDRKTGEIVETTEKIDYGKDPEPGEAEAPEPEKPETPAEPGAEETPAKGEPEKPEEPEPGKEEPEEKPEDKEERPKEGEESEKEELSEEERKAKDEAEEQKETPKKPKKPGRLERRVDKLTATNSILEEENARLRAGQQPAQPAPIEAEVEEPPKESDYDSFEKYNQAVIAHEVKKGIAADQQQRAEAQANARNQEIFSGHQQRVSVARENHDDWDEVAEQAQFPVPPGVQLFIMQDEAGAEILYHLAKNPEVSRKLSRMPDVMAIAEVGRIAASLAGSSSPAPVPTGKTGKPVSKAPKPTKPVGGSGTGSSKLALDDPKVPMKEFNRRRDAGEV